MGVMLPCPTLTPNPGSVHVIPLDGQHIEVSVDGEGADTDERGFIPASRWVDGVKFGDKWYPVAGCFSPLFGRALDEALQAWWQSEMRETA